MTRREKLHLEGFLPYRLSVLSNTVSSAIAAAYFANFGLSIPEWRIVAVLAANPGLSAAEVTARTAMDKVAVSRAVALHYERQLVAPLSKHERDTLDRVLRVLLGRAVELGPAHAP